VLQCKEIDQILTSIDAVDTRKGSSDSLYVDGFGVFGSAQPPASLSSSPPIIIDDQSMSFSSPDSDQLIDQFEPSDPLDISDILPVAVFLDSISPSELLGSDSLNAFDFSTPPFTSGNFTNSLDAPIDLIEQRHKDTTDLQVLSPSLHHDAWLTHPIPRAPPESPLTKQERFLMSHYANRVVRLFCVIDNAKSPWKSIHLPRALQSVGELTITGSTSRIQGALRNALLAISAFYLSNDNKSMARKDDAAKWANEATRFRCKAINFLKEAVENDFYTDPKPKYKEFLATMLSMISINVRKRSLRDRLTLTPFCR
jgi:arginine metabolism regulation protein II